jgi:hypothetical protein
MTFADLQRGEATLVDAKTRLATMGQHGLTRLASGHADFDRVPWLTRYEPI